MKTLILGLGYVGFHLGVALSDGFEVLGYDVDSTKMAALSSPTSLFPDAQGKWKPNLIAPVTDLEKAARESEFAFLALPTDFSPEKNFAALYVHYRDALEQGGSDLLPTGLDGLMAAKISREATDRLMAAHRR